MAEDYRARDTRRRPRGGGHSPARRGECVLHPNICTIYDAGADPPFIAMELLEGETPQQRLTRGPLDTAALMEIARGIADALDAAHAAVAVSQPGFR